MGAERNFREIQKAHDNWEKDTLGVHQKGHPDRQDAFVIHR